ncbi:hypothetical protein QE359_000865 [Curtobacterium sp. SORGH_AS776]|nr:hypothetical protein [Curtobacterium sp. SORGH_AS_0776]
MLPAPDGQVDVVQEVPAGPGHADPGRSDEDVVDAAHGSIVAQAAGDRWTGQPAAAVPAARSSSACCSAVAVSARIAAAAASPSRFAMAARSGSTECL